MKKTKYIMSSGLAFAEQGDMEKLSKKAKQGWHLKNLSFAGYTLEKLTPKNLQYSIDYRLLKEEEEEEYFELFQLAGWEHVCSSYDVHIFKANPGTTPIYSDTDSEVDKTNRLLKPIITIGKYLFPITILFILMMNLFTGPIQQFSRIAFFIALVLSVPTLMMIGSLTYRKWKESTSS